MEQQYLGLRPGRELLGRLGQNGVRPKLTGTGELLTDGGTPPGRHALELDLLTDGGVEEACHDGSLPFCDRRRLTR